MEILGHTLDGKIIIVVSQEEWDGLQEGRKPTEAGITDRYERFTRTEIAGFFRKNSHLKCRTTFLRLFYDEKFDGTLDQFETMIFNDNLELHNVGDLTRNQLKQLLRSYRESSNNV